MCVNQVESLSIKLLLILVLVYNTIMIQFENCTRFHSYIELLKTAVCRS